MVDNKPGYYAIIPASVRYDDTIQPNAKLLYGEISALISDEGYCYANNQYFSELYGFSVETIARLLTKLENAGHIKRVIDKDETGQIIGRRLYLTVSIPGGQDAPGGIDEKINTSPQKNQEGIDGKINNTNTSITDIEKESKKEKESRKNKKADSPSTEEFSPLPQFVQWIVDTFGDSEVRDRKNDLYFAFVRFSDNRTALKKPFKTQMAVTSLCNRLLRLTDKSEDKLAEMIDLLDASTINGWQSVYQRGDAPARQKPAASEGRRYEEL